MVTILVTGGRAPRHRSAYVVIRTWKRRYEGGASAAVTANKDVVPASQLRDAQQRIRELEWSAPRRIAGSDRGLDLNPFPLAVSGGVGPVRLASHTNPAHDRRCSPLRFSCSRIPVVRGQARAGER